MQPLSPKSISIMTWIAQSFLLYPMTHITLPRKNFLPLSRYNIPRKKVITGKIYLKFMTQKISSHALRKTLTLTKSLEIITKIPTQTSLFCASTRHLMFTWRALTVHLTEKQFMPLLKNAKIRRSYCVNLTKKLLNL